MASYSDVAASGAAFGGAAAAPSGAAAAAAPLEPESYLLSPSGLRRVLDSVVAPEVSGITAAIVVTEEGDNLYHSSGMSTADANLHAGIAFTIWQTHKNAMERAAADSKNELSDVGDVKMILMQSEKGLMCMYPCHTWYVALFARNMDKAELGMIRNRAQELSAALAPIFKKIFPTDVEPEPEEPKLKWPSPPPSVPRVDSPEFLEFCRLQDEEFERIDEEKRKKDEEEAALYKKKKKNYGRIESQFGNDYAADELQWKAEREEAQKLEGPGQLREKPKPKGEKKY